MRTFSEFSRPAWLRYGGAVVASAAALLLTGLFWPFFRNIPFMPAFLAIFLAGWFGGGGPSFLAVALCGVGLNFFFYPPASSLWLEDAYDVLRMIVFLVVGSLGSLVFRQLWAAKRQRAQLIVEEEKARASAETVAGELEQILESITDGFCALDRASRYKYVNRQAEEILGRRREELLGKSALEGSPMSEAGIGAVRKAMDQGETRHAQAFNPVLERWLATDIYPSPDGVVVLFRDITDRKHAQEEIRRMAAIVESSEDAIVSETLDGVITSWNAGAQSLFGYKAEEIVGRPVSMLMPRDRKNEMQEILERIRRGERVEHFETVRLTRDGGSVPVSLSVSPVKDESGNVVEAAKIARDITEQKRQQTERERLYRDAQEAARVREEFLSVAGHELRTPLTSLQFQLHTLRRRVKSSEQDKAVQLLDRAAAQLQRLARLTEELLDVTRITTGRLELELEETDLGQILKEVVDRQKDSASRSGCELRVFAPEGITGIWDRSRLDQVITNLLSNAVKFSSGKPIEVRADLDTSWARLTVEDHGIGISPEDQAKIFERFERAVSKRSYGGLGLGLWITRQIVDAHHGRIDVTSRLGQGSTFRIELPLKPPGGAFA